jgi:hypothetical protein
MSQNGTPWAGPCLSPTSENRKSFNKRCLEESDSVVLVNGMAGGTTTCGGLELDLELDLELAGWLVWL